LREELLKIVPIRVWDSATFVDEKGSVISAKSVPILRKNRNESLSARHLQAFVLDKILSSSRIIIIEGISGSGKDTLQAYLKKMLKNRDVYDYSEGELLHSWKQFPVEGIFELRIKFMKHFVDYITETLREDQDAVFLLNRFHLSAYVFTIIQQPKLEAEYEEIINRLRTLPVYVFMLQLDKNEIEERSLHPERSAAWRKFQQQIAQREGFRGKLERYISQQRLMLEAAKRQQIPYSLIKLSLEPEIGDGQVRISKAPSIVRRSMRMNAADASMSKKKRHLPPTL
jgi:thymidylate kinase